MTAGACPPADGAAAGDDLPMRVLVLPDKFKGSLTAAEVADAIGAGIRDAEPDARIRTIPIADGGDGTLDVLVVARGVPHDVPTTGPLGDPITARWVELDDGTAVVELAATAGLQLVPTRTASTAWRASTAGTAAVIRDVLDHGLRRIVVAAGGVASTDAGAGLLIGLGATARDADGGGLAEVEELDRVDEIDLGSLDPRLRSARWIVATDVNAPLLGPMGAARLYASQKGADAATVEALEARGSRWVRALERASGRRLSARGRGGAAGGVPLALAAVVPVDLQGGLAWLAERLDLAGAIAHSDLVIAAEGRLDRQSLQGKAPVAIAELARAAGVPVIALVGALHLTPEEVAAAGFASAHDLVSMTGDVHEAMRRAAPLVRELAATVHTVIVEARTVLRRGASAGSVLG